jgi:hypothetical protein
MHRSINHGLKDATRANKQILFKMHRIIYMHILIHINLNFILLFQYAFSYLQLENVAFYFYPSFRQCPCHSPSCGVGMELKMKKNQIFNKEITNTKVIKGSLAIYSDLNMDDAYPPTTLSIHFTTEEIHNMIFYVLLLTFCITV